MEITGPNAGAFMAEIKFETHAQCVEFIDAMLGRARPATEEA
ncbi:hypothetical protein [Caulobacter sp. SSI4214]|nr:hypothetical protein [Caulobacter sp. SSI4214]